MEVLDSCQEEVGEDVKSKQLLECNNILWLINISSYGEMDTSQKSDYIILRKD